MRTSYHVSQVPIPQSGQYLLFQMLRGAVDVVSGEVAEGLRNFQGAGRGLLDHDEAEALRRRGYLTEQSPEQEQEQARGILRVLSRNLLRVVELNFRLPDGVAESAPDEAWLDETFSLAGRVAGERGAVVVGLEVSAPQTDARAVEAILRRAAERSHTTLPRLTLSSLGALAPWLKSENFRQVLVAADRDSMPEDGAAELADQIVTFFNRQVHPVLKCHVDGMSAAQLSTLSAVASRVRRKYSFFRVYPVSTSLEATAETLLIGTDGDQLPCISAGNEALLNTLLRFISMAGKINYRPFFQPEPAKLSAVVETRRLSFQEGRDAAPVEGAAEINALAARGDGGDGGDGDEFWESLARSSSRLNCKYALVCGCGQADGGRGWDEAGECSGSFEQRVRQVLPLLLFNLPGNWRPAEAHA